MRYVEKLSGRDTVKVTMREAQARNYQHGVDLLAALEALARSKAGDRVLADTYTTVINPRTGAYTATFALVPE